MTRNEIVARIGVINRGVDLINADLKKLGPRRYSGIDSIAVLEDYRFHICQERMQLMAELREHDAKDNDENCGHGSASPNGCLVCLGEISL